MYISDMICAQMPWEGSIISYNTVMNNGFGKQYIQMAKKIIQSYLISLERS
jgi:hypothetical protein